MAYTCVRVNFELGHEASIRPIPTSDGFTHDWELFVRGADNTEIHHFVEKVIFHLHESFHNPKRVIKEPPYAVRESGYAGFALRIEIYFKNKHEPSRVRYNYDLTLQDSGPTISNVRREKYVFKNPSEDFRRKLIRGGGVGVGAESASGSHTNHMAALNSDHSADDHKNLVNNKNKGSPQDGNVSKKSKKENTPKNEEQLSANDPFSIFGQPIKTSKIPLVSKTSSKQQISDKAPPPQEKQTHSSKSSKHSSSSHKDRDKDKDRGAVDKDRSGGGSGGGGGGEKEKEKTKDKDKDKNALKKGKDDSKKEKIKDDKVRIIKTSSRDKDDSKKNSSSAYHDEKAAREKSSVIDKLFAAPEKESKAEKKEKEKKHKEEKKSKSKEKHKNNDKKENIEVKESYADRAVEKIFASKDELKEEKKFHKLNHAADEREEKPPAKEKNHAIVAEPKNLFGNSGNNANPLNDSQQTTTTTTTATVNNGDATGRKEEKHKHHKHKKDKSKKDAKRDKEERKEKREMKENKEKPSPQPVPEPAPVPRSTPKRDSPRRVKKPLKTLFAEMSDKSDSDMSSLDDEPSVRLPAKEAPAESPPHPVTIKEEPATGGYPAKQDEQAKENKFDSVAKKKKKSSEDRENKKRKRKTKEKEENAANKMIKYEQSSNDNAPPTGKQNAVADISTEPQHRPKSMSPASETKFTDEYITKLKELQRKIMTLEDNSGLQQIVQVVAETGQYEITTKTFDFDLCTLDESIVQRLLDFFVP